MRSQRGSRRSWATGPIALAAALSAEVARGQGDLAEPIRVAFEAPAGCPDLTAFLDQVTARTPKARLAAEGERARTFKIVVTQEGQRARGRLTIEAPPERPSTREVTGEQCNEVVSALSLITALAVDPRASTGPPESLARASSASSAPPPQTTIAGPPGPPLPPYYLPPLTAVALTALPLPALLTPWAPARPTRTPGPHFAVALHAAGEGAIAPDLTPGGQLGAELYWERKGSIFSPSLRLSTLVARSDVVRRGPAFGQFTWIAGRLEGCPLSFTLSAELAASSCVIFDAGALSARGGRRDATPTARVRPWIAPGLIGRLQWRIAGPLFLELEAGATFPLVRDTFYVARDFTLQETPIAGALAAGGVSVRFF